MTKKQKKMLCRIIVTAVLVLAIRLFSIEGLPGTLLYLAAYLIIGYDILRKAGKGILRGQVFDENFLMAVATVGAIGLAFYEKSGDFMEAVAVMLFYQIGELFQSYAVGKSRRNITALMDIRPDYANIEQDGQLTQVDPDDVPVGATIVVQPGEKVPLDGVVLEGTSTLNTAALTGESLPRDVTGGDEIVSGCINMTGVLKIRTTRAFGESTVSKILELVENSSSHKSKSENFISKFARVYTPAALRPLLAAVDAAAPLAWFEQLGLYTRTDEAGRVYPYSNQAADVLALLELHLQRHTVQLRTGCTVNTLRQSKGGYAVQFTTAEGGTESLRADAVICAMGGAAGPQFGTDGFGTRFAADCGGQMRPLYPCLTALQCAKPNKSLAGIRAKAAARLLDGDRVLAEEMGEVQFTDYGLSGICIMQLSGLLAPGRSPKHPAVELDLFPAVPETELAALFAARAPLLAEDTAAAFWLGLLHGKLGRALWAAAALPDTAPHALPAGSWQKLAHTAKHWRFEGLAPCGWRQAQTTGGGLALTEVEPTFQFKGCPGLYFVGETLDCAGSCGGFNLHWAFGSGLAAGRDAAKHLCSRKR